MLNYWDYIGERDHEFFLEQDVKKQVQEILRSKKPKNKRGLLIVFEGCDGAGKTTQTEATVKWLEKEMDYQVVQTEWNSSKLLESAIKKGKNKRILTPMLYSLLHAADMVTRYEQEILPALSANKVVLADRYIYTSIVRDKLRGVDVEYLDKIYSDFRDPDILFHCVLPIHLAFSRLVADKGLKYYGTGMDLNLADNREDSYVKYADMMDKMYRKILPEVRTYHKLDMRQSVEAITDDIKEVVKKVTGIGKYRP